MSEKERKNRLMLGVKKMMEIAFKALDDKKRVVPAGTDTTLLNNSMK